MKPEARWNRIKSEARGKTERERGRQKTGTDSQTSRGGVHIFTYEGDAHRGVRPRDTQDGLSSPSALSCAAPHGCRVCPFLLENMLYSYKCILVFVGYLRIILH